MDKKKICSYELTQEGGEQILKVNCLGCPYGASIEGNEECMARTIDKILEAGKVDRVVLAEAYENEYGLDHTRMLSEVAQLIQDIVQNQKLFSYDNLGVGGGDEKLYPQRSYFIQKLLLDKLRRDPLGGYIYLLNAIESEKVNARKYKTAKFRASSEHYLKNVLLPIKEMMDKLELVQKAKDHLRGMKAGDRSLYEELFLPIIRPNFTLTRFMATPPTAGEEIDRYEILDGVMVRIFSVPDKVEKFYFITPPEFQLSQDKYYVLGAARQIMAGHKPIASEFSERAREYFERVGRDLIMEIAKEWKVELTQKETKELATILVRYTAGLGIMEILLADPHMQDLYINAPIGEYPIKLLHAEWLECVTNIIPTKEDAEALAARFRLQSGRPLDEANPVLDTEAQVPGGRARVCVISKNLSPDGLAFVFRRHRDSPWTFPLFIDNKAMNSLCAGLLSFVIDGGRCILYAGPRSSGKSSVLGASLVEIMRKYRILTVEDTLELPIKQLREMGFNIVSMKVQSAISKLESELPADQGIRTALRLGDSCLIVGEVRSKEANALYEAMRVGALSNVVSGTIHADDPAGLFDRVVHDLGVHPTSFKATDLIVMPTPVRSPDGLRRFRRIVYVTEVTKSWTEDPVKEGGFQDLMVYNADKDTLEPTETLLSGKSDVLMRIASRIKGWSGHWDKVWDNIQLRAKTKQTLVDYKRQYNLPIILEGAFVGEANDKFHHTSAQVAEEYGELVSDEIFNRWDAWLKERIKSIRR